MKTITIGRVNCDIILPDDKISRKHATISLVGGQYVYQDMSKNGTVIGGRLYQNEKVVIAPGTPVYLANSVPLPWPQVLMLLPTAGIQVDPAQDIPETVVTPSATSDGDSLEIGWGIVAFLFPIIGFILYFVWSDTNHAKAKQASNIAWISIAIAFVIGFISGLM